MCIFLGHNVFVYPAYVCLALCLSSSSFMFLCPSVTKTEEFSLNFSAPELTHWGKGAELMGLCFGYVQVYVCVYVYINIERETVFILFFSLWLCCKACRILVPQPGIDPASLAVKAQSPNHLDHQRIPSIVILFKCPPKYLTLLTQPMWPSYLKLNKQRYLIKYMWQFLG